MNQSAGSLSSDSQYYCALCDHESGGSFEVLIIKRSKVAGILPADFFPFHLAFAQVIFFLAVPLSLANHYLWRKHTVMFVTISLESLMFVLKPLLLCLVCVERYMAVVRPIDYHRFKARRYRWECLLVSWCIYGISATVPVIWSSSYIPNLLFLFVLIIDTFCCLSVLEALQKPPPGDKNNLQKGNEGWKNVSHVSKVEEEEREEG